MTETLTPSHPAGGAAALWTNYRRELSVGFVYLLLLGLMAFAAPAAFKSEIRGTWIRAAPVVVAAIGMTLIILARHIDVSIGAQFSLCAVAAALLAKAGVPMPAVLVITIVLGMVLGAINGALVAVAGLPAIVVTLATMAIIRESLRWARQGEAVQQLPVSFQWFGQSQATGEWALIGVALIVTAAAAWACYSIFACRAVYAVGSDPEAARLAGIRPWLVGLSVFIASGALTALAATLNAVRFPQVDPNVGNGLELQVIAAVVVGGTAISGGRGNLIGTLIGVAFLVSIGPALTLLKLPPQWERAVQGAIILIAVSSNHVARRGSVA